MKNFLAKFKVLHEKNNIKKYISQNFMVKRPIFKKFRDSFQRKNVMESFTKVVPWSS